MTVCVCQLEIKTKKVNNRFAISIQSERDDNAPFGPLIALSSGGGVKSRPVALSLCRLIGVQYFAGAVKSGSLD